MYEIYIWNIKFYINQVHAIKKNNKFISFIS